jgi:hypothetical protein
VPFGTDDHQASDLRDARAEFDVVPRPAMFVEMVTLPGWPARAMISASCM